MSRALFGLVVLSCLVWGLSGQLTDCAWTVDGFDLDLSTLMGTTLTYNASTFIYSYTPCSDDLSCTASGEAEGDLALDKYMAIQNGNSCWYLAKYNRSVSAKKDGDAFSLSYANGQEGRKFVAKFECGSSTAEVKSCDEASGTTIYTMVIATKLACDGSSDSDLDGLSLGSILLIVLVGCVLLYCVIGYIICAKKNPDNGWKNVKGNTPHLEFWCAVPKLTWAGCCVTKEAILKGVNKVRGKGDGEAGDYETVED